MFSFYYQELVGGAVFLLGIWLVFRGGELGIKGPARRWLFVLVGGFVVLALLQGLLQWAALS